MGARLDLKNSRKSTAFDMALEVSAPDPRRGEAVSSVFLMFFTSDNFYYPNSLLSSAHSAKAIEML